MTFCNGCGQKNSDDSAFCQECGAALKRKAADSAVPEDSASSEREVMSKVTAKATSSVAMPLRALRDRMTPKMIGIVAGGVVAIALAIGLVVVLTGPEHFSESVVSRLVESHLNANRSYVDSWTCLSNFPYDKDPVTVNAADSNTQRWLGTLVEEGIYDKPEQRTSGGFFPQPQFVYRKTETGKKATKGRLLCFAEGLEVRNVENIQKPEKFGDSMVARAVVTLGVRNLASWAKNPVAQEMVGDNFKREMKENFRFSLNKDKKWEIGAAGPARSLPTENPFSLFDGGVKPSQQVSSRGFFDKLKGLFSFGNPLIGKWKGGAMGIELFEYEFTADTMRIGASEMKVRYEVRDSEVAVYPEGQPAGMIFKKVDADTMRMDAGLASIDLKRFK